MDPIRMTGVPKQRITVRVRLTSAEKYVRASALFPLPDALP